MSQIMYLPKFRFFRIVIDDVRCSTLLHLQIFLLFTCNPNENLIQIIEEVNVIFATAQSDINVTFTRVRKARFFA